MHWPSSIIQLTAVSKWTPQDGLRQVIMFSLLGTRILFVWFVAISWFVFVGTFSCQGSPVTCSCVRTSTPASARERSMAHRERISSALRRAQLLQLEKRTEYAWRLQMQSLGRYSIQIKKIYVWKKQGKNDNGRLRGFLQINLPC